MSTQKTLTDARFLPATRSFCVAHAVYKGGTKFDLNPQRPGGLREIDRWGIPYVIVNVRGSRDVAKRVLREGLNVPFQVCPGCGRHIPSATRSTCKKCGCFLLKDRLVVKHFRAADGYVRAGDGATLVLFGDQLLDEGYDSPTTPAEFRKDLGVAAEISSDSDMLKFQKYFKRFLAPVRVSVSGPVVEWLENGFVCELWKRDEASGGLVCRKTFVHTPKVEDTFLEVGGKSLPAEQFYDGSLRISTGFASWLVGRVVEDGEGLQVTLTEPKKLYKGLAECVIRQRWDVVAYLGKKQLHSLGDTVTFQVMQELHPSDTEFSDVQSVTALDQADQLAGLAVESMHRFRGALSDAGRVGADLDRIINCMTPEDLNDVEDPAWALIQAHRVGLPVTNIPWARRRLIGFFFKAMLNMKKFRVPLPDWTIGLYGAVDRSAFDENGLINVERAALSKNECVIPFKDRGGEVGMIRRPIANKNEQSFAMAVRYDRPITKKCPYVYLALELVPGMVQRHGGMDWDDRLQICMDAEEIARRKQNAADIQYPLYTPEVKVVPAEKKVEDLMKQLKASNPFLRDSEMLAKRAVARDPMDSLRQVMNAVMGRRGGITIEGASNRIIVDNANLNNREVVTPQLYRVSADLEAIIDSTVHVSADGLSKDVIARDIDEFDRTVECCEEALITRLPKKVWIDGEVVEVRNRVRPYQGKLTIAQLTIEERQKQFMALLDEETGVRIRAAFPVLLESVVETKEAREVIAEMVRFWSIRMANDVDDQGKSVAVAPENVKRRLRGELVEIYKQRGWDLEQRDVRTRFEDDLGVEAYKATQKELYLEFDGKPNTLQAAAIGLKRAYCDGRGGDGKFSGNHTVRWFIAVWQDLSQPGGPDKVKVLGEVAVRTPKGSAPAALAAPVVEAPVKEPSPVVEDLVVPVVAGLEQKYGFPDAPEVVAFRKRAGSKVELVPCLHLSEETGEYEDAVLVMDGACDGKMFASCVTDEDFLAAYPKDAYIGYVARPHVESIFVLSCDVSVAVLEEGGPFSLKARVC